MQGNQVLPTGASWLTPYLTVTDAEHSLSFYQQAFGFGRGRQVKGADGRVLHAEMTYQGKTLLMLIPEYAATPLRTPAHSGCELPLELYVYCANVDLLARRAREAGAIVRSEPVDRFWGDRIAQLQDPDGYLWTFATRSEPAGQGH